MRSWIAAACLLSACRSVAAPAPAPDPEPAEPQPAATPPDPPPAGAATEPADGPRCGDRTCAVGESCVEYFGIAGPRGPMLRECAIRCRAGAPNQGCPPGTRCRHVADGPGPVCR